MIAENLSEQMCILDSTKPRLFHNKKEKVLITSGQTPHTQWRRCRKKEFSMEEARWIILHQTSLSKHMLRFKTFSKVPKTELNNVSLEHFHHKKNLSFLNFVYITLKGSKYRWFSPVQSRHHKTAVWQNASSPRNQCWCSRICREK